MTPSPEAQIRRATPNDHDEVRRLMDEVDALHRQRLPWMFKLPAEPPSKPFFAESLQRQDSAVFVAEAGHLVGVAVGLMRAAPELPMFIAQRWGVLDSLVVDSGWRRRGIGKRLASSVEHWALGSGAAWVEVNVYHVNPEAQRFYEALGYTPLSAKLRKARADVF